MTIQTAPLRKGVRLHRRLEDTSTHTLLHIDKLVRVHLPLIERVMPASLGYESTECVIVLPEKPGDAYDCGSRRVAHEPPPQIAACCVA